MNSLLISGIKKKVKKVNWPLLVFLLVFLNVKLVVKLFAVIAMYIYKPNLNFGFHIRNSRLPLFYLLIIAIAILDWVVYRNLNVAYSLSFATGLAFWLLCILAVHQIKLAVEQSQPEELHKTIIVFFLLNAMFSIGNYISIVIETQHINPYTYQGNFQKYFLNTGDYIKGVIFDVSITNAIITSFGVIYFLLKNEISMLMVCMLVLLLTTSNAVIVLLLGVLILIFLFRSNKLQKSLIVICLMMLVTFMAKVTIRNIYYVDRMYNKVVLHKDITFDPVPRKVPRITDIPDDQLTQEQQQDKKAQLYLDSLTLSLNKQVKSNPQHLHTASLIIPAKLQLPQDSVHTPTFQSRKDTNFQQYALLSFINKHKAQLPLSARSKAEYSSPGKLLSFQQTLKFFKQHPLKILTGDGMGNFSSKLAFRTASLNIAGGYPDKYQFINADFLKNHLDVYLNFFSRPLGMHSVLNSPDSVYNQLFGEYGIAGLAVFAIAYLGFFLKRKGSRGYGLPLLAFTTAVLTTGYWFEQLSILVLFELLMFINFKMQMSKLKQS